MEWILLLLAGGLAAGVGLWAARPGTPSESQDQTGRGPSSSPALPGSDQDRGKAVRLGPQEIKQEIKELLDHAPRTVRARGVPAQGEQTHSKTPLKVTYNTDQLIARSSRHAHHRRVLQNAELMVQKQKGADALELFERVQNRIADPEVQGRIQTNIDDIRRWLAGFDTEDDNLKFPEIVVPLTLQNLALENLSEGLRQLSESLVTKIAEAVRAVNAIPAVPAPPGTSPTAYSGPPIVIAAPAAPAAGPATSGTAGAAGAAPGSMPGPSAQAGAAGAPLPTAGPAAGAVAGQAGAAPAAFAPAQTGGAAPSAFYPQPFPATSDLPPGAILPVIPRFYPPSGEWLSDDYTRKRTPASTAAGLLPPGMTLDDQGNLITDGWTDADFEREWEKYKNLPPYDRRSGIERRKAQDRRGPLDQKRKDRRSGTDRRQKDLFKEREEFLKKLEEHKKRKRALEEWRKGQKLPELPPVELPLEPAASRKPEAVIEISNAVVNIGDLSKPPQEEPEKPPAEEKAAPEKEPEPEEEEPRHVIFETPPLMLPPVGMPGVDTNELFDTARDLSSQPLANLGLPSGRAVEEAHALPPISEPEAAAETAPGQAEAAPQETGLPGLGGEEGEGEGEPEEPKKEAPQIQEIRGVLELKPPEEDDAPFLTLTYDFSKIPDSFKLSRDYHTMEYAYYKYKPMLVKAQEFTRRKMLKNALNYYRVIKSQNIPPEFKRMIHRNIKDITEYLEKFLMSRAG